MWRDDTLFTIHPFFFFFSQTASPAGCIAKSAVSPTPGALHLKFSKATGIWMAKETGAYVGEAMGLQGKQRAAMWVSFLHQEERLSRYVDGASLPLLFLPYPPLTSAGGHLTSTPLHFLRLCHRRTNLIVTDATSIKSQIKNDYDEH